MEMEQLEPRVKPLGFKVKAVSRESSPSQKAAHVLDPDLRSHWSAGTNTKEWILLELDEPCLLSHIRIYNKSVLEWEITVGLRYKPETFVKVRPRCEAPRRDMIYPMNYTACRFVRISCLRGNPIAIFFMQLIGVSITALEPDFQPVVNYLLPHILSHKQDAHDMHLQLLQDITDRLLVFLPHLEIDLSNFTEAADSSMRFLAMLAGPFYPILRIVKEREATKTLFNIPDFEALRTSQASSLTVSSNFEPRKSRSPAPSLQPVSSSIAFRSDVAFMLLRKAYKDPHLGLVCRLASRALQKLIDSTASEDGLMPSTDFTSSLCDDAAKAEAPSYLPLNDYSSLFGEEFRIPDDQWDDAFVNLLDIASVEEGVFHILYACASQPLFCCKLAESNAGFLSVLPLIQALLPALRPPFGTSTDQINDSFSQWKHPLVQRALSQIVALSSSSAYRPLLHACAGYFSSFSMSQAKAACILIDLCSGPLAPWLPTVTAKVDLAIELLEDLLGTIQGASHSIMHAQAALKYITLALSGHMDDMLAKYKEVKHRLLFLLEMLEPFLEPAMSAVKNTIAFGDVSTMFLEKQEETCAIALNIIRTAVQKPAVLPSLEHEWRRGSVAPSVLLSILGPNMPLPPEIDLCKCSASKVSERESPPISSYNSVHGSSSKSGSLDEADGKVDSSEISVKVDASEDANLLFVPLELKNTPLRNVSNFFDGISQDGRSLDLHNRTDDKNLNKKISYDQFKDGLILDSVPSVECLNLQADYLQLVNFEDCQSRASEFQRLALDLHSQHEITPEGHDAAIDALLLAAECYVNPFFMMSFRSASKHLNHLNSMGIGNQQSSELMGLKNISHKNVNDLETIVHLERKRDKTVLEILLQAAELDREFRQKMSQGADCMYNLEESCKISPLDMECADSITLVRQNQVLLCHFVMRYLQRDQPNLHEILLQSLLFLLQSATELFCPPEGVIDIILQSAEHLNRTLSSFHYQRKEGSLQFVPEKLHGVQRRWVLLQKLVIASSGVGDEMGSAAISRNGFQYRSLVPPSSWIQRIPVFSTCPFPLVRFLGWMAVSHLAKKYLNDRLFLSQDLSHLTLLLSFFADELALTENIAVQKVEALNLEQTGAQQRFQSDKDFGSSDTPSDQDSFHILHPDLYRFFPTMRKRFAEFGEIILQAVCLQLRSFPSTAVPDLLCWFSDLCISPFLGRGKDQSFVTNATGHSRGFSATNVKAIILYVLEALISEHLEAMLPEMPRVAQILVSLCGSSYCDVTFLGAVFALLKPLISYALCEFAEDESLLTDELPSSDLELLCFEELFSYVKCKKEDQYATGEKPYNGSLVIFILGALFPITSFVRKKQILQSFCLWTDFSTSGPTTSFYDYLLAFQRVMDSCNILLVHSLENFGISIPFQKLQQNVKSNASSGEQLDLPPDSSDAAAYSSPLTENAVEVGFISDDSGLSSKRVYQLCATEIEEMSTVLDDLILKLCPAIEACWSLHFKLAKKLAVTTAKCLMFLKCLTLVSHSVTNSKDGEAGDVRQCSSGDILLKNWGDALEGLAEAILANQQNHCWQVSSCMLDYVLELPLIISYDAMVHICSVMKNFCCLAPRITWRLQADKWLLSLIMRDIASLSAHDHLVNLFCAMLSHWEPEQRYIALRHLGRLVGLDVNDGVSKLSNTVQQTAFTSDIQESIVSNVVSGTWDKVAAVASSDPSVLLRVHAMALLSGCIPFAGQSQLQSFLVAADALPGFGKHAHPMQEGPITRLSVGLLANACLHSPAEDISLIPDGVWQRVTCMAMSKTGGLGNIEKTTCKALCKLRTEPEDAKEALKEVLFANSIAEHRDPEFTRIRESILQVVSSLTSAQAYLDFFSKKNEQESQELDEAEIELELLQKERALQDVSKGSRGEVHPFTSITDNLKIDCRLQQIKDEIHSIERSKIRDEIAARRQKKLLMQRNRQKYLEEAAQREIELLRELDRVTTSEAEHEIERQRFLELERAKTRELRYNLDMERERQTQRDLQRELEQVESGVRPSRRDFSLNPNNRPRERYRERENGRMGPEGSLRPSSRGQDSATTSGSNLGTSVPTLVLAGSRTFSGQTPTILQPRERPDERGMVYEDNYEGSRDSGDASSVGDPDVGSSLDASGLASGPRQGRGSKSRQIVERREREGRREGKWERKHS